MRAVEHLVIGAGAVGCSVAFHLAARGREVRVVDSGAVGGGTSSAGFGLIWSAGKSPKHYLELSLASQRYYPEFLDAIGDRVDYDHQGGMIVLQDEAKRREVWPIVQALLGTDGFVTELLEPEEARRREPALGPDIAGAIFSPHEAHLTPTRLVPVIAAAARRAGAHIAEHDPVRALGRDGDGWRVATASGVLRAARVTICAGVWTRPVAALAGVDVPIFPDKGQVLQTAPQPPLIRFPGVDVRQASDGRIWMGTIHAGDQGFNLSLRDDYTSQIRALARSQFPSIADLPAERIWAGLRPMPIDGLPILGAVPGAPNLFVAAGHSGITLNPIQGRLMAVLLDGDALDPLIAPYSLARFGAAVGAD